MLSERQREVVEIVVLTGTYEKFNFSSSSLIGPPRLRKISYMSALVVKNRNPDFAEFADRLKKNAH
jgi:hypothetical protein